MNFFPGACILLLSCIGNAELWVVLINRRHSLRYKHYQLRRVRTLHDMGLLIFPVFILLTAGIGERRLLTGGTIDDLPTAVQWILAITFVGLIPFTYSIIRWNLRRKPKRFIRSESRIFDTLALANSDEARHTILGEPTLLSRFPRNQIYHLEVNTKQIQLNAGAASDRCLRIAHFSDMHLMECPGHGFRTFVVDQLRRFEPDFFVFTGDLLDRQHLLPEAVEHFRRMRKVAPGYFILGNHDWHLDFETIRRHLVETGWIDVGERSIHVEHQNLKILIAGTETPWIGTNPDVPSRQSEALRLLLSHAPDQRNYAQAKDFDLMLSGHNHGGQVVLPLLGPVYSPSCYGVQYSGGVFEYRKMLMHVSRGTGAKDTLRWNCPPEITLLHIDI